MNDSHDQVTASTAGSRGNPGGADLPYMPALLLGIASQLLQILLLRELLMIFHGNELSVGLILACWMGWVGLGSRLGAGPVSRTKRPGVLLAAGAAAAFILAPVTLLLIRSARGLFGVSPGAYFPLAGMVTAAVLLTAPLCLLLGFQFVAVARLRRERGGDEAKGTAAAGRTYSGEAAGSMIGGLLFTFLIVHFLDPFQAAVAAGSLLITAVLLTGGEPLMPLKKDLWKSLILRLFILFAVLTLFFRADLLDNWGYRLQWGFFSPQHRLVEVGQSRHGAITVLRLGEQYSFFQSGQLIFSSAGPEEMWSGLEERDAVELAHLAMNQHTAPGKVLLIGGGMRGLLGEMVKYPVERIDYLELDDKLTALAAPYISPATRNALDDTRVRLIHGDGRLHLKASSPGYDLIIVDAPDPATAVLNRFYTVEFYREVEKRLNPGGVLVTGAVSTPEIRGRAAANRNASLYHTLGKVFERVLAAGERNIIFFATNCPDAPTLNASTLRERYTSAGIETESFSADYFFTLLEEGQLSRLNWVLNHHGRSATAHLKGPGRPPLAPPPVERQFAKAAELEPVNERFFINSDLKPIGFLHTLIFWDELTGRPGISPLSGLLAVEPWWPLPLSAIMILGSLGSRFTNRGARRHRALTRAFLFGVFTTGFSTMTLQVALLFAFQGIYGFIYEMVGLITALFMGGLAAGSFTVNRVVPDKTQPRLFAAAQLAVALFALLVAVLLPLSATLHAPAVVFTLYSVLTFTAGLVNGAGFPLALACCFKPGLGYEQAAGKVYAVELFGACLGAILTSVAVAPALGIASCCLLAALANGTAFVILVVLLTGRT